MSKIGRRSLQPEERAFLEKVANKLPHERSRRLAADIQTASVRQDGDFLCVDLPGYLRPDYRGHQNLPFEGRMRDVAGGALSILINMDQNDRLLSIEFIFWEASGTAPDWTTLTIVPEQPAGTSA